MDIGPGQWASTRPWTELFRIWIYPRLRMWQLGITMTTLRSSHELPDGDRGWEGISFPLKYMAVLGYILL